ncbi:MAG: hypothetical protein C9356_09725 [Oleiphilus sp.]|nr:MAG: hypothetical protein C9356_09725 [Oleiphilus sp.]
MKALLFILLLAVTSVRAETLVILPEIEYISEQNQQGLYNKIWKLLLSYEMMDLRFQVLPFKRAVLTYEREPESCFGLGNSEVAGFYLSKPAHDPGEGYYHTRYVIMTLREAPLIESLEDLKGLSVGNVLGDLPQKLPILDALDETPVKVVRHKQLIAMLQRNRLDAVLGATSDILPYLDQVHYSDHYSLFTNYESIICQQARPELFQKFRKALKQARRDNAIEAVVSEHSLQIVSQIREGKHP